MSLGFWITRYATDHHFTTIVTFAVAAIAATTFLRDAYEAPPTVSRNSYHRGSASSTLVYSELVISCLIIAATPNADRNSSSLCGDC